MAERDDERALRGLTGSAPSIVGVEGALRARDVSRPGPGDHAGAARLPLRQGPRVPDAPPASSRAAAQAKPSAPPAGPAARRSARSD